jgi:hypothetical protein
MLGNRSGPSRPFGERTHEAKAGSTIGYALDHRLGGSFGTNEVMAHRVKSSGSTVLTRTEPVNGFGR